MLHPGVVLRSVVAQHDEGVHPNSVAVPKKHGTRKESGGVLVPVLRLHLVLDVVPVSFLKVCDNEEVPLCKVRDHLVKSHALHRLLPAVSEEAF